DRSHAITEVSLSVVENEIVCIVGESGSGKSMMANAIMRLLPQGVTTDHGRILFVGRDLCVASDEQDAPMVGSCSWVVIFASHRPPRGAASVAPRSRWCSRSR